MIDDSFNVKKSESLLGNSHLTQELEIVCRNYQVLDYYKHIIKNINIDKNNINNSYVMWVFDKVDNLDINLPTKIIEGRISLPDVDMDFQITKRASIIEYMKRRFGRDKVAQMLTFTRMQGRSALKDVMRAWNACSFSEMNEMTKFIPDEAEISDQLQIMKEESENGEASIIMWALEHNSKELAQWAHLDEQGNIQGDYAKQFEQAIRLEGTKRSQSKHAAGVIISESILADVCPMVYDKNSDEMICGMEMDDLESAGHTKWDILGIAALEKLKNWCDLIYHGDFQDN